MKKILTALSVLTFASAAGSLIVTVLNTSSQKSDAIPDVLNLNCKYKWDKWDSF
ncbi:hypothetical protein [Spiroplasma endosymbiont of Aleiodes alternator]|uniref:hypothetical protein n=1 Tax=Spiroplasma endosymbiont of Aleiodes alternator TaxID=3139329 RepID=UPI003CCAD87E